MDHDALARLGQLQARVSEFGQLASRLSAAIPKQAAGCDASGCVRVVLDRDGLPSAIEIQAGWQQRLRPAGLAAAVVDANAEAIRQAMIAFANELGDGQWWAQRARLDEGVPQSSGVDAAHQPPGTARELAHLTEDILKASLAVRRPRGPGPERIDGSDPSRHVTVTLGPAGLVGCSIDAWWAARRDGKTIAGALLRALRDAKSTMPPRPAPGTDLDDLIGDALATLRAVTRHRPPGVHPHE